MATRPPWRPSGGGGILLVVLLLAVVAGLIFWAWSAHPPGSSSPVATGVPPTSKAPPAAH